MRRLPLSTPALALVLTFFVLLSPRSIYAQSAPFSVISGLFDQSDEDSLGLSLAANTETITVFSPTDSTDKFSNGVVLVAFDGYLYCQWQSSAEDEDAPDTWVAYSRSQDGITWSAPMELAASIDEGYSSSGGWWVNGDTLVAYINTWPEAVSPRGGYTRYITSTDGLTWSDPKAVTMANGDTLMGIFEQDPDSLPGGRIISAAHFQPGLLISPIYTDDPSGVRGWLRASYSNLSVNGNVSRGIEPSWYLREDSAVVMTFRDQEGTYRRLASVSTDRGATWSTARLTNMPDSRSKQSAGNLPDGEAYLVGNPRINRTRIPLAITLSPNGFLFNTAYLLRAGGDGLQPLRYEGRFKREGYHYPKSMIHDGYLYVSYSTNKEDVEFTRVPLANLEVDTTTVGIASPADLSQDIKILMGSDGTVSVTLPAQASQGLLRLLTPTGQLLTQRHMFGVENRIQLSEYPKGIYLIQVLTAKGSTTQRVIIR